MSSVSTLKQHPSMRPGAHSPEVAQSGVVRFLLDPATLGGEPVRHIVTHISHIFLAGRYAWKLKRAVMLPFVDFSTLEGRKDACENEVRLNRRTAPELYLDVEPVTKDATGRLAIGGAGKPVDWLVRMRRFKDGALLSEIADAGNLSGETVDALGDQLVSFHDGCEVVADIGGYQAIADVHKGLARTLSETQIPGIDRDRVRDWNAQVDALLCDLAPLLDARARHGFMRHCHGDMHLENIVLLDGHPVPFDAIEFSDKIATTDVLYDLAFPVMDLMCRGEGALANRLMNRYLAATRDYAGLSAWPVFLSLRAVVRAAVLALKGDAARRPTAQQYFALAEDLLRVVPAQLTAVGGLSGSGKSTLAGALALKLGVAPGAVILSSDVTRKRMFDVCPEDILSASAYHGAVSAEVYNRICDDAKAALMAGASVIADATFLRVEDRAAIEAVANEVGVPFQGYWLDIPPDVLRARVAARASTGPSDAGLPVLERQLAVGPGIISWQRRGQEEASNAEASNAEASNTKARSTDMAPRASLAS